MKKMKYGLAVCCVLSLTGLYAMDGGDLPKPDDIPNGVAEGGLGDTILLMTEAQMQALEGTATQLEAEESGNKLAKKRGEKKEAESKNVALLQKRRALISLVARRLKDAQEALEFFEGEKQITTVAAEKLAKDLAQLKEESVLSGGESSALEESLLFAAGESDLDGKLEEEEKEVEGIVREGLTVRSQKLKIYEASVEENRVALDEQVTALRELLAKKTGEANEAKEALKEAQENLKGIEDALRSLGIAYEGAVAKELMEELPPPEQEEVQGEGEEGPPAEGAGGDAGGGLWGKCTIL